MTDMKAAICLRYGPPEGLVAREVGKPQPRAGEVLVRIHAMLGDILPASDRAAGSRNDGAIA